MEQVEGTQLMLGSQIRSGTWMRLGTQTRIGTWIRLEGGREGMRFRGQRPGWDMDQVERTRHGWGTLIRLGTEMRQMRVKGHRPC